MKNQLTVIGKRMQPFNTQIGLIAVMTENIAFTPPFLHTIIQFYVYLCPL